MNGGAETRTAMAWLASAASDPENCRREWERSPLGVVLLPAGRSWDVLILPGVLGRCALELLASWVPRPGPVLAHREGARVGFFVPPGTTGHWLGTGVRGVGRGGWIATPRPNGTGTGARWLIGPDGSGALTDPAVLELAMHEAVALLAGHGAP